MAEKLMIAFIILWTTVQTQKEYCRTLIPKLLAQNEENGGKIPGTVTSRLQGICEKAITCTDEGCHGPFVRDKGQCAACSTIIVPFMKGELKSAKMGLGRTGGIAAYVAENGIKLMLPQPEDCQKLGNAFCKWQKKLQDCANENKKGNVPREECAIADPCKGEDKEGCDSEFRTINGVPIDVPTERPWIASLHIEGSGGVFICGGGWISKSVILTAKHCVVDFEKGRAGVGSNEWGAGTTADFTPSDVELYPGDADIAVINIRASETGKMKPISLPASGAKVKKGDIVSIAGWGVQCENPPKCTSQGGGGEGNPQEVVIPVVCESGSSSCEFPRPNSYTFLAGGIDENGHPRDSCSGDSGSTLICAMDDSPYACGVVSSGPPPPHCGFEPGHNVDLTIPEIREWVALAISGHDGTVNPDASPNNDSNVDDSSNEDASGNEDDSIHNNYDGETIPADVDPTDGDSDDGSTDDNPVIDDSWDDGSYDDDADGSGDVDIGEIDIFPDEDDADDNSTGDASTDDLPSTDDSSEDGPTDDADDDIYIGEIDIFPDEDDNSTDEDSLMNLFDGSGDYGGPDADIDIGYIEINPPSDDDDSSGHGHDDDGNPNDGSTNDASTQTENDDEPVDE